MISRIPKLCIAMVAGFGLLAALLALSAPRKHLQEQQGEANHAPVAATNIGGRKFKQNCSRCHESPQSMPPRISGTVLRHMRVRASLSEQDERDILKFLNP